MLFARLSTPRRKVEHKRCKESIYVKKLTPHFELSRRFQQKQNPVLRNAIPVFGVKPKRGWYVFGSFFKVDLCSAISFKRSWRERSIDVAEHRTVSKSYRNTHYPRFSFIPKTGIAFPKTGWCFYDDLTALIIRSKRSSFETESYFKTKKEI